MNCSFTPGLSGATTLSAVDDAESTVPCSTARSASSEGVRASSFSSFRLIGITQVPVPPRVSTITPSAPRSSESAPDEEFEDIDDESILEGCQKAFRNVRRLKWHYRSRCESLIRFSNESFYKDSPLITFPAAKPGSFSIDLVRINGSYQARRNHAEAKGITQAAVEFMRHHADLDEADIPTLGLVALNIDQRDLIQEELRRISVDDVQVREYSEKVMTKGEPLFVKNLENVQGDERDFIFISLTYGREPGATSDE